MANIAVSSVQNYLPVQAYFNLDGTFNTFIGQGQPFQITATEAIGINNTTVNTTVYPTFTSVTSGVVTALSITSSALSFNPSTGILSSTGFSGALAGTASSAANLTNGSAGQIPFQTSTNNTAFTTTGTIGQVLTSNGTGTPYWSNASSGLTISSTTGATTYYPTFATGVGIVTTEFVNTSALTFTSGILSGTFSGNISGGTGTFSTVTATNSITSASTTGAYSYGTLSYNDTNIFASYTTSVNSYAQVLLQNTNSGSSASIDYVVSNDLGTASTYYGNFGMNSSGFVGTGSLGAANYVYLYSQSTDIVIGTASNNLIHFAVNSSATDSMTIDSNGANIPFGTSLSNIPKVALALSMIA